MQSAEGSAGRERRKGVLNAVGTDELKGRKRMFSARERNYET